MARASRIIANHNFPLSKALCYLWNFQLKFAKPILVFVAVVALLKYNDTPIQKPLVSDSGVITSYECIFAKNQPKWLRIEIKIFDGAKQFTIPNTKKLCGRFEQNVKINSAAEVTYSESGYKKFKLKLLRVNGKLWYKSET